MPWLSILTTVRSLLPLLIFRPWFVRILGIWTGQLLPAFPFPIYDVDRWSWLDAVGEDFAFVGAAFHAVTSGSFLQSFSELLEFLFAASQQVGVVGERAMSHYSGNSNPALRLKLINWVKSAWLIQRLNLSAKCLQLLTVKYCRRTLIWNWSGVARKLWRHVLWNSYMRFKICPLNVVKSKNKFGVYDCLINGDQVCRWESKWTVIRGVENDYTILWMDWWLTDDTHGKHDHYWFNKQLKTKLIWRRRSTHQSIRCSNAILMRQSNSPKCRNARISNEVCNEL